MLLRALQFHARAAAQGPEAEPAELVQERLAKDNYVGLFVSAQRLLEVLRDAPHARHDPFATLFMAYGLEAVRALHHLHDVDASTVSRFAYKDLAKTIADHLTVSDGIGDAGSAFDLENRLSRLLTAFGRGERKYSLTSHPNAAFPALAEAIRRCADVWQTAHVLFLLDDVSTRYLKQHRIEELLSALLFQSPVCAFKLTSEAQTIELGLKSPGQTHPARVGRDLSVFDLGAEVYEKIKKAGSGNGPDFVENILKQRKTYFPAHPEEAPSEILGNVPLETIAEDIGRTASNSRGRKRIYRGITALARVCVGDIGDVIGLYEQILKRAAGKTFPVAPEIQSDCFQDFCARRLYDLNRRGGFLKDIAKSFAEASHRLLVKSCKGAPGIGGKVRVRQYLSLYVRITTGNLEQQTRRLLELIDAGVFVFAGGSTVPRTKTRDSNPTQQFKLTYRKIYGLVNFIGLAERDRFELSGEALEEWLAEPSTGAEVLLRHLGGEHSEEELDQGPEGAESERGSIVGTAVGGAQREPGDVQISLFDAERKVVPKALGEGMAGGRSDDGLVTNEALAVRKMPEGFPDSGIHCVVVGLGFEERTLESARRLCASVVPRSAVAIEYTEVGKSREILRLLKESAKELSRHSYQDVIANGLPGIEGNVVVDITGLAKPVIFHAIRNELRRKRRVWVCHTEAKSYYPLNDDLEGVLRAEDADDRHGLLEELRGVLTGEEGPYEADMLLPLESDVTRQRMLCAFASPKHERLLSLLDDREYDRIEIVAPESDTPRNKVAQLVAEVAARNKGNANVERIDVRDISRVMEFLVRRYAWWYVEQGLAFELGLTGSKLQAVAAGAVSAAFKVSQCWYLRPQKFDPERFTEGVGATNFFEITLRTGPE